MVIADNTRVSWIINEFLHEIERPSLPVNLFISPDKSVETVLFNGPITQKDYIDAINKVGGK